VKIAGSEKQKLGAPKKKNGVQIQGIRSVKPGELLEKNKNSKNPPHNGGRISGGWGGGKKKNTAPLLGPGKRGLQVLGGNQKGDTSAVEQKSGKGKIGPTLC